MVANMRPSGVSQALLCPAVLPLLPDAPRTTSPHAERGTAGHEFIAHDTSVALGLGDRPVSETSASYWDAELEAGIEACVQTTVSIASELQMDDPDAEFFVEHPMEAGDVAPGFKGTADFVGVSAKHGIGVVVDQKMGVMPVIAEGNDQLMAYAVLMLQSFQQVDFKTFRLHINQPAVNNFTASEVSADEVRAFAMRITEADRAARAGAPAVVGSHCKYCNARSVCADYAADIEPPKVAAPEAMSMAERAALALRIKQAADALPGLLAALEAEALGGAEVPGWKLVAARSNRRFSDQAAVAKRLTDSGMTDDQIYTRSLPTLSTLERALGSTQFASLLGDLVTKPEGKPTLVPSTDTRQAISTSVDSDFS